MRPLISFVTLHPKIVLLIGILLAIPLAYMQQKTPLNYDIFTYTG